MILLFVKLLLAHLLGDFLLQPTAWVKDKEKRLYGSPYLYIHTFLHGILAWMIVGEITFAKWALLLAITHGFIDLLKLRFQKTKTKRRWFVVDQILHLLILVAITYCYHHHQIILYALDNRAWIVLTGILLLTTPTSITIKNSISIWTPEEPDKKDDDSLENAGKYIGILERLFVFFFIIT